MSTRHTQEWNGLHTRTLLERVTCTQTEHGEHSRVTSAPQHKARLDSRHSTPDSGYFTVNPNSHIDARLRNLARSNAQQAARAGFHFSLIALLPRNSLKLNFIRPSRSHTPRTPPSTRTPACLPAYPRRPPLCPGPRLCAAAAIPACGCTARPPHARAARARHPTPSVAMRTAIAAA